MRDVICDGFYDVWGDFPEIVERDEFPTLAALRHVQLFEGDPREVHRGRACGEGVACSMRQAGAAGKWVQGCAVQRGRPRLAGLARSRRAAGLAQRHAA
jgi:hypothetical protein